MARSEGNNSQDSSYRLGTEPCFSGWRARVKTSWKAPNVGRRFYSCPQWQEGGCGFFEWAEEELCKRSQSLIPGLMKKFYACKQKIENLEESNEFMENENWKLKNEMRKLEKLQVAIEKENTKVKMEKKVLFVLMSICILLVGGLDAPVLVGSRNGHTRYMQLG